MAQTRSLPRICIALGLPDVPTLLDHARREAEAGETFLEFRLDHLDDPWKGADAIPGFLEQFPDSIILAGRSGFRLKVRRRKGLQSILKISDLFICLPKRRRSL